MYLISVNSFSPNIYWVSGMWPMRATPRDNTYVYLSLGQGTFATVREAKDRSTGAPRAIKSVSRAGSSPRYLEEEIRIMRRTDHVSPYISGVGRAHDYIRAQPNIIKFYDVFMGSGRTCKVLNYRKCILNRVLTSSDLVLECAEHGTLLEHVQRDALTAKDHRIIARQLCTSLQVCVPTLPPLYFKITGNAVSA